MAAHCVLVGYGDTGRTAALTIAARTSGLVVLDTDPARISLAVADGARAVTGDGRVVDVLRSVDVASAASVIIAVPDDDAAMRITWVARRLSPDVAITTLLRSPLLGDLATELGADRVVVTDQLVGRTLGLMLRRSRPPGHATGEPGITVRPAKAEEVGRRPADLGPMVFAVIRNGARRWRDDPDLSTVRVDDDLVVVHSTARERRHSGWSQLWDVVSRDDP